MASAIYAKPFWIDSPSTSKYIGGVGIVKGKENRRVANIKARAELLESVKVYLKTKLTIKDSEKDGIYHSTTDSHIEQKAKGSIKQSYIKDTYNDKDGYYYVWMVIER